MPPRDPVAPKVKRMPKSAASPKKEDKPDPILMPTSKAKAKGEEDVPRQPELPIREEVGKVSGKRDRVETFDDIFDELAAKRWRSVGRSWSGAEPPTLMTRVGDTPGKGELWLSGLPTADNAHTFPKNAQLQSSVFYKRPTAVGVGPRGREVPGILLP